MISELERRRIRLAHVTTADLSLRFLLWDQLHSFREAGFEVIGISAPGPWVADLEREGVRHFAVPALQRRWAPLADLPALAHLVTVLRRTRPDIVHTHTPKARILGRIAARLAGVPIVVNTFHGMYGMEGPSIRRQFYLWLERVGAMWSDFELSQSREDLETLHRARIAAPSRSAYLGNGVNLQLFDPGRIDARAVRERLGIGPDQIVVGTVGRLVWEKGYREYFAAAEALVQADPRIVMLAVGPHEPVRPDGIPAHVVEDLTRRGIVRFLGMRTDVPELYAIMDIFVLPSYREGFPRSAVEAAAMGRPLVLTDIRGCREVVEDGRNGLLFPVGDATRLLASVRRLIDDPALRTRLGQESRRRAAIEFDERRVIATTLDVYRRLLAEKFGADSTYMRRAESDSAAMPARRT